jgi:hypothetical protein
MSLRAKSTHPLSGVSRTSTGGLLSPFHPVCGESGGRLIAAIAPLQAFAGLGKTRTFGAIGLDPRSICGKLRLILNSGSTICSHAIPPGGLAMRLPARATITWLLAGLFALVSGIDEGWHFIPGCGHAVELPGRYIFVGLSSLKTAFPLDARSPGVRRSQGDSIPCYDEDECPICRLCGQGKSAAETARFCLVVAVLHAVPATPPQISQAQARQPFDARAPPIG